jgi:CubicO group peptidase (beta-lactamase class C family)
MKTKNSFFLVGTVILLLFTFNGLAEPKSESPRIQTVKNVKNKAISVSKMENFISINMEKMKIPGLSVAIINNGEIVYHEVRGVANSVSKQLVDKLTIFEGCSISKPMFAYLVMHLVDEGKLDLDRPLYGYLTYQYPGVDYANDRFKKITARTVLSHSSGFPNWREQSDLNIQFEPGSAFGYSGEGYQYLVKAIESILDTDYLGVEAYFQEKIALPLGLQHTKYVQDKYNLSRKATPHKNGKTLPTIKMAQEFNAASAMHSEAAEFAKWLISVMNKDSLTVESYTALFADQIKTPNDGWFNEVNITHWTLGFAKHQFEFFGTPIYGHIGNNEGFTSLFLIEPSSKWGVILFTNADLADDFGFDLFDYLTTNF